VIPKIQRSLSERLEDLDFLKEESIPKKTTKKNRLFSKGEVKVLKGKYLEKFPNLQLKGLNIYGYEFGICYPQNRCYPIFIYQCIYVPKRAVVTVNYAYYDIEEAESIPGFQELLKMDEELGAKRLYKTVKPQYFLVDEVIENSYNGMVNTESIDKGFEDILTLFQQWYQGLDENYDDLPKETEEFCRWKDYFKDKFFAKDYGYIATKRYLGKKWSDKVFKDYLR